MPVMCIFRAPGVTPADYDNMREFLEWEGDPPPGGLAHFISFKGGEAVEVDIWASRQAFETYYDKSFKPALRRFGLELDEPEVLDLHNLAVSESIAAYVLAPLEDAGRPAGAPEPRPFALGPLLHGPDEGYVMHHRSTSGSIPDMPQVAAYLSGGLRLVSARSRP